MEEVVADGRWAIADGEFQVRKCSSNSKTIRERNLSDRYSVLGAQYSVLECTTLVSLPSEYLTCRMEMLQVARSEFIQFLFGLERGNAKKKFMLVCVPATNNAGCTDVVQNCTRFAVPLRHAFRTSLS